MEHQPTRKHLLDPYRTLGCFVAGRVSHSETLPYSLTVPTGNSFKVYSQSLMIKVASPPFQYVITAALSYNQYTYMRTLGVVVKMKYHHVVAKWTVEGGADHTARMMRFDGIVILAEGNLVHVINEKDGSISTMKLVITLKGIVHPMTYVNKLLAFSQECLQLVNPLSNKILYNYPQTEEFIRLDSKIVMVEAANLVDIIMMSLQSGRLICVHLKKDSILFTLKQKKAATAIVFSADSPWMATGDELGNIILWDLQQKKILYKMQKAVDGLVDSLLLIPGYPILTCGSSQANCLRQLRINLEDNKILSLYRERIGMRECLKRCTMQNSNMLMLHTEGLSMSISLNYQCNNYVLPRVLHSCQSTHIVGRHFQVDVYQERTLTKSYNIHEKTELGRISLSRKYFVVATKSRIVKLGGSQQLVWKIAGVKDMVLQNEHFVYAFTPESLFVCDFSTDTLVKTVHMRCANAVPNQYHNLLAFECLRTDSEQCSLQVWQMDKIVLGRQFTHQASNSLCLAFTSENKYLISSHRGKKLLIWNIVHNTLSKQYELEREMLWMGLTLDGQFMVSVLEDCREVHIWNNYIGRISTARQCQKLPFVVAVREIAEDYRKEFVRGRSSINNDELLDSVEDVLDSIADAEDGVPCYDFSEINKWHPLAYYDEIKQRNTPEMNNELPSLPFFLDFRNLDEEKRKLQAEMQEQLKAKRKAYLQDKDKLLANQPHAILLHESSPEIDYISTFSMLIGLSVAEVDYQLRKFLLNQTNGVYLLRMMREAMQLPQNRQIVNIMLYRILSLLQTSIFDVELREECKMLLERHLDSFEGQRQVIDRCVAIVTHERKQ